MLLNKKQFILIGFIVLLFSALINMGIFVFSAVFYLFYFLTIKYKLEGKNYFFKKINLFFIYLKNPNKFVEKAIEFF